MKWFKNGHSSVGSVCVHKEKRKVGCGVGVHRGPKRRRESFRLKREKKKGGVTT